MEGVGKPITARMKRLRRSTVNKLLIKSKHTLPFSARPVNVVFADVSLRMQEVPKEIIERETEGGREERERETGGPTRGFRELLLGPVVLARCGMHAKLM